MFRFICVVTTVVTFLILSIPLLIAEWIIGKFNPTLKDKSSKAVIQWAFGFCLKISGVEVTYIGKERIPTDTAVLYVPNHTSAFDILLTYVQMPSPTGYVAKDSLQKWPLLSNWMRNIHCLFLDRSNIKEGMKMILAAIEIGCDLDEANRMHGTRVVLISGPQQRKGFLFTVPRRKL